MEYDNIIVIKLSKDLFGTNNNNNNNNSYIALYPVKIYKLAALYIKIR